MKKGLTGKIARGIAMDPKNRIFASNLKRNTEMRPTRSGFFADLTRALADTQTLIREMHPQSSRPA